MDLFFSFLMDHNPNVLNEEPFLPPLMKRQLAYVQDLGNFSTPLSKCSVCLMYFSSEAQFKAHVCRMKTKNILNIVN